MLNGDRAASGPLREALAQILLENAGISEPRGSGDFLTLVTGADALRTEADSLLHTAVVAARNAGATWHSIGSSLGMTKQAAQKRFAPPVGSHLAELDPSERIIGPTTSFDEMQELALAGRYGWHSVEFGATYHRVVRSNTQWEHLRVMISPARIAQLATEGWSLIGSSFPYTYLKRDAGIPALENPPGDHP